MTPKQFLVLVEIDEVSRPLLEVWQGKQKENPIEKIRRFQKSAKKQSIIAILCSLFALVFLFLFLFPDPRKFIWSVWPVETICLLVAGIASLVAHSERRLIPDFALRLEELRKILELNYGQIAVMTLNELKARVEKELLCQAKVVISHQDTVRDGGYGSTGAKEFAELAGRARMKYEKKHTTCAVLGLIEEKWDRVFKLAGAAVEEERANQRRVDEQAKGFGKTTSPASIGTPAF